MLQAVLLPALLAGGLLGAAMGAAFGAAPNGQRVLVFHKQNGFVHTATPFAAAALKTYLEKRGLQVEPTVDTRVFTEANLAHYATVVFLNTNYRNGSMLTRDQEAAFESYVRTGGGFVGIHSAVPLDGEWEETQWPWYARLFGGRFHGHQPYRQADLVFESAHHPSTATLPGRISMGDEWYAVFENPLPPIRVLANVEDVPFPAPGGNRPMTWCQEFEGGRSWVTLVGHDEDAFRNPQFMAHLHGGILWAGGWDADSLPGEIPTPRSKASWRLTRMVDPTGRFRIGVTSGRQTRTVAGRKSQAGTDPR